MKRHSLTAILTRITLGFLLIFTTPALLIGAGFSDLLNQAREVMNSDGALSSAEIIQGLKEALRVGTEKAVGIVSATDGFYHNPDIKIPLPGEIEKADKYLRMAGYGETVDAFELSMNRAAERAAPEAKSIFEQALRDMTFEDAEKILNGRDNEATLYFKKKTYDRLQDSFKPLISASLQNVGATRHFMDLNSQLKTIPFADKASLDLDQYVTEKSLNGLFFMLAEEEKKIRSDPAARTSDLLRKVFARP
jgi:hypothetical protein